MGFSRQSATTRRVVFVDRLHSKELGKYSTAVVELRITAVPRGTYSIVAVQVYAESLHRDVDCIDNPQ